MANKFSNPFHWLHIVRSGHQYMQTWPRDKRLAILFPENRIINATLFSMRITPLLTFFTLGWHIFLTSQLGPVIAMVLFAASLPLQGLLWLGKRALSPLPPLLLQWFNKIRSELLEKGEVISIIEPIPTYQSLAKLLNYIFNQSNKKMLDDL